MRNILAVVVLGVSLAFTASTAMAESLSAVDGPLYKYPLTDTMTAPDQSQPTPVVAGPLSAVDGPLYKYPLTDTMTASDQSQPTWITSGPLSVVAGPGIEDGYNPYRANPRHK